MGQKLCVEMAVVGTAVVGRILGQPDSINRDDGVFFRASDGFRLGSHSCPALLERELDVRGSDSRKDDTIFSLSALNAQKATAFMERIARAIHEYNPSLLAEENRSSREGTTIQMHVFT